MSTPSTYTPDVSKSGLEIDILQQATASKNIQENYPGGLGELTNHLRDTTEKVLTCYECPCGNVKCRIDGVEMMPNDACRFPTLAAAILAERAREGK